MLLAVTTGLRRSELFALKWKDVVARNCLKLYPIIESPRKVNRVAHGSGHGFSTSEGAVWRVWRFGWKRAQ